MAGLWVWTASRAFLKILVKFVIFLLNFCAMCWCESIKERKNDKKKEKKNKMYTQDLLQIVGNPRYNPISDPAYDIDKYSKLCAGVMFVCEGEVLLLQRNSNNNDLYFDLPGGNLDYEDFQSFHNALLSKREYKQRFKAVHKDAKKGAKGIIHSVADSVENTAQRVHNRLHGAPAGSNVNEQSHQPTNNSNNTNNNDNLIQPPTSSAVNTTSTSFNPSSQFNVHEELNGNNYYNSAGEIHHSKRAIYPQIPLYDSFYFADIFSSQFQTLGLNSWQQQGQLKRKQLERLHEQSIRHHQHGFGFESGCWNGAVRECHEEIGVFPSTVMPLAIFNLYRGWSEIDSSSDDSDSDPDDSDSDSEFDLESQMLVKKADGKKEMNGKRLNINVSLMGNGKVISDNFRRYTLYICSITPEQRNTVQKSISLSEEHTCYGWFPLCLLIPMQTTVVGTFRHFKLHPWIIAFMEQYSTQFDKLSRKTFWVGYNRHFDERIEHRPEPMKAFRSEKWQKSDKNDQNDEKSDKKTKKMAKKAEKAAKLVNNASVSGESGNDGDIDEMSANKQIDVIDLEAILRTEGDENDEKIITTDQGDKTMTQNTPQNNENVQNTENDETTTNTEAIAIPIILPQTDSASQSDDEEDGEGDNDNNKEKKKKGKKNKNKENKEGKKKNKEKKDKNNKNQLNDDVFITIHETSSTPLQESSSFVNDDTKIINDVEEKDQNGSENDQNDETIVDQGFSQSYYDENEVPIEYDPRDVFISTFLPLVKRYINPNVYL